jgi:DNA N-6-adenine-methyltransferase (Dam)
MKRLLPAIAAPSPLPASYRQARAALDRCVSLDECKAWADKSAALASYAAQAKDDALLATATRIRARAIRRCGELLQQFDARGAHRKSTPGHTFSQRQAAAAAGLSKHQEATAVRVANVPAAAFHAAVERAHPATIKELAGRVTSRLGVHFSSESAEHYTPAGFLDAVRAVFGDFPDLDPCSNSRARPNVQARTHYTAADDGLARPWFGRVFWNPPYGEEIAAWIAKFRHEWQRGAVREAIGLLPARTDTEWFDRLTSDVEDFAICFLQGRLTFVGNADAAPFPSMAVYFGLQLQTFARVFGARGSLWTRPPRDYFVDQAEADLIADLLADHQPQRT